MFISEKLTIPIFLRLGKAEEIQAIYENSEFIFSCPANWLDYGLKNRNLSFGDYHECAFACVTNADPDHCIENARKRYLGNLIEGTSTEMTYLYKHPNLLRPTTCFYHLSMKEFDLFLNKAQRQRGIECANLSQDVSHGSVSLNVNATKLSQVFDLQSEKAAFLIIRNISAFFDDLRQGIIDTFQYPKNIEHIIEIENGFDTSSVDLLFNKMPVTYYPSNMPFFYDDNLESFKKSDNYSSQREFRIQIARCYFLQKYSQEGYDFQKNLLRIPLKHIKKYADVFTPPMCLQEIKANFEFAET